MSNQDDERPDPSVGVPRFGELILDELPSIEPVETVPAPPPASAPKQATPEEWAKHFGLTVEVREPFKMGGGYPSTKHLYNWQHSAAAQLHGWNAHKQHSAEPFTLSLAAYRAALIAAASADELGNYTPHEAALSPFAPKTEEEEVAP